MTECEIFEQAIKILDLTARAQFLDTQCGENSELRTRLDGLLKSHDNASFVLKRPGDPANTNTKVLHLALLPNQFDLDTVCQGPLEDIDFDEAGSGGKVPREKLVLLKQLPTLKWINGKPADEFWIEFDKN